MSLDDRAVKRHWHLAVWEVPQVGSYAKVSTFAWSKGRHITIPELTAAKQQRKVGDGAVLVNVAYMGFRNQYELTGLSPEPVPSTTTPSYNLGLEQALTVPDPETLVNAFEESDTFNYTEWALGCAQGKAIRLRSVAAAAKPPANQE